MANNSFLHLKVSDLLESANQEKAVDVVRVLNEKTPVGKFTTDEINFCNKVLTINHNCKFEVEEVANFLAISSKKHTFEPIYTNGTKILTIRRHEILKVMKQDSLFSRLLDLFELAKKLLCWKINIMESDIISAHYYECAFCKFVFKKGENKRCDSCRRHVCLECSRRHMFTLNWTHILRLRSGSSSESEDYSSDDLMAFRNSEDSTCTVEASDEDDINRYQNISMIRDSQENPIASKCSSCASQSFQDEAIRQRVFYK